MQNEECRMQNEIGCKRRRFEFCILHSAFCVCLAFCISLSGCNIVGAGLHALPPPVIEAQYRNLAGQSVGVLVWCDRGISIDWPSLPLDTANAIENNLLVRQKSKIAELKGTRFDVKPASILRYMRDHPELQNTDIAQIA